MAGLIEKDLRSMDMTCKKLNLEICSPEESPKNSDKSLKWIEAKNIKYLAVHWDLDVLSQNDFRSLYTGEQYVDVKNFPWLWLK